MPQLEKDAKRVLDKNYPNSKFPSQGFVEEKPWWDPTRWL
jgi:outer membrane protein assembly factor BamD